MCPVLASTSVAASDSPVPDYFCKDGRTIRIGDCALFKPPQNSPPFIGIIQKFALGKEENIILGVNWIYRPADIKLEKGIFLEAAPNEVFYSFHKDEIPAASLLHPCKIAFLRKGVELPSRVSSFVCRRVYDTENKCLWWLTDKDYINERQEEVDKLLNKTRIEMHGPTSTSPLKPGPDSVQNSNSSFSLVVKGKKRERDDLGSDPIKRARSKTDDEDSVMYRPQYAVKSQIAKITDKGGLVDFEGVEKLIQLMQPEKGEKTIDLAERLLLVDVIAFTDRFDCLERFVQLRGVLVLDEWLQEIHKRKITEGSSSFKEREKIVEKFLFALLRALEKLPVNLQALQTSIVGKSVNYLRSHKNSEIQKKARSLVDSWKKRVEAEMNMIDTTPVSSIQPTTPKSPVVKLSPDEPATKSPIASLRSTKSPFSKEIDSKTMTPIKEEKSSNSSQSQNNSRSYSSDRVKAMDSPKKEDARSFTTRASSLHKKSSNGTTTGYEKTTTLNKNVSFEKGSSNSNGATTHDNNTQRLIVRFPNTGRSPAQSASGGSVEEPTVRFETQEDMQTREKGKPELANVELCEGKYGVGGAHEGIVSPIEKEKAGQDCEKFKEASKMKSGKSFEASFSSINALIDSASALCGDNRDEVGMNLLASVAAGEITKSDTTGSPLSGGSGRNSTPPENGVAKLIPLDEDIGHAISVKCEETRGELNNEQVNCSTSFDDTDKQQQQKQQHGEMGFDACSQKVNPVDDDDNVASTVVEAVNQIVKIETKANETAFGNTTEGNNHDNVSCSTVASKMEVMEEKSTVDNNKPIKDSSSCSVTEHNGDCAEGNNIDNSGSSINKESMEKAVKLDFDLNEGFPTEEDESEWDNVKFPVQTNSSNIPSTCPLPFPISSMSGNYPTPIRATKGPFVPPENLPRPKGEVGWKGSAPTSAFRPAEPRKVLDIDLNVTTDDSFLDDIPSQNTAVKYDPVGGFDLDLNKVDEVSMSARDFDLNNGPGIDELGPETAPLSHLALKNLPFFSSIHGVRTNHHTELGNFTPWFPHGNSYSAVPIPSILPVAGGSQRILSGGLPPVSGTTTSFAPMAFQQPSANTTFPYPGYSFETSFPSIPQFVGPTGVVQSNYHPRGPYLMGLPGCTSGGIGPDNRKWGNQGGLDLNAGSADMERFGPTFRQVSVGSSPVLSEEQLKMYQMTGGVFKRKEPDGWWDSSR